VTILVCVLSSIAPAIQWTRPEMGSALKGERGVRTLGRFSFTNALVVTQVALSLVLLIGAGLFLRSLRNLKSVNPGFDPGQVVVLTMEPVWNGYSRASSQSFFDALAQRARNLPGVIMASVAVDSPLSGQRFATTIEVPGYVPRANDHWRIPRPDFPWMIPVNWVGPGYFRTLSIPLLAGRDFRDQDGLANKVAIVDEQTAAHYWPQQSPIGKHILMGGREAVDCEIVGVVKDVKSASLREGPQATVYMPFRQGQPWGLALHVRVAGETKPVMPALIREIHALDPNVPALNVTTIAAQLDRTIALDRFMAALTVVFGLLAVALAAVGLYGVMTFAVAARTREIGIRMALGASQTRVLGKVLSESAVLTAIGIALGVPGALWASRGVGAFLYGLSATDPWIYIVLAFVLAGIALSAAWIPARRAAQVDPWVALRYE
jgi:predicted permease